MSFVTLLLVVSGASDVVTVAPSTCPRVMLDTIAAELVAAGFTTDESANRLGTIITRCDEPGQVLVRVEDNVTHKAVERTLELSTEARVANRVAVQVVELLHASLAETRFASLLNVPERVERFLAEREAATWRAELGAGAMVAPGGFGIQPSVCGALWRSQAYANWALELGAAIDATVHATRLESPVGTADIGLISPRVNVAAAFEALGFRLAPRLGVGALLVWANGQGDAAHTGNAGVAPTFAASVGVAVGRQLTGWFAVGLSADVSLAPVPVGIAMPDSTKHIGAPFFAFSLHAAFR